MMLKLLKVQIVPTMMAGTMAARSSGMVIFHSCCQPVAPSMRAASYSSSGMACSAPVAITVMKGQPSQMFASHTAQKANGSCMYIWMNV